jgi:L-threonylcarbamoyladenylate synthase
MLPTERLDGSEAGLARAAVLLRRGGLVAFPTETVYGLGADATSDRAVAGIYAAKGRPRFNPLIAHVADLKQAQEQGRVTGIALELARAFWPGPLTLVVPVSETCTVSELARAGLASVALRVPAHPLARDLISRAGLPIAAPSANRSGRVSPTEAAHVAQDLDGCIDAILDAGATEVGVESTIVSWLSGELRLLRTGGVTREQIEAVAGPIAADRAEGAVVAPGMLASHYAPNAAVRLDATTFSPNEAALLFGPVTGEGAGTTLNLSENGDLVEAAARLFSYLRRLDETGASTIAVSTIPSTGLGEAINDRLRRAAADR